MSPIVDPRRKLSLTKHYSVPDLVDEIAVLEAGMDQEGVKQTLRSQHPELSDDLFRYDDTGLVEDVLVRACKHGDAAAPLLVWCALLLADQRIQNIVTVDMTWPDGRLNPAAFSKHEVRAFVEHRVGGASVDKAASNVLRWAETAGLVEPERSGGSIVGIANELPTAFAVPQVLELLQDRLEPLGVTPSGAPEAIVDLALGFGVNHWLNLTRRDFRAAAAGRPALVVAPKLERGPMTPALERVHVELSRKRQLVLQGPPGTGKTFAARSYVEWFAEPGTEAARLTAIASSLPETERTPARIADEVQRLGLPGVWDVVQFHAGYSYERFVRGLQSTPVSGGVSFVPVDRMLGLMARVGAELESRGDATDVLLLIDEINRGDIAKVFGELLYAVEYRGEPVSTPYAIDGDATLVIPRNLKLLGTMNTADQSIAMVDKALRRRFAWLSFRPERTIVAASANFAGDEDRDAALAVFDAVASLFDDGDAEASRLQVGHSYFLLPRAPADPREGIDAVANRFAVDIWPLLEEYEAEGLVDPDRLTATLTTIGWGSPGRPSDQQELATSIAQKLARPSAPPSVA